MTAAVSSLLPTGSIDQISNIARVDTTPSVGRYTRPLTADEINRRDAIKQQFFLLKPNSKEAGLFHKKFNCAPPELSFSALTVRDYLKEKLRPFAIDPNREFLFFDGGSATHIVCPSILFGDVDLTFFLELENDTYEKIRGFLIDFVVIQLQERGISLRVLSDIDRRQIQNTYLHKKVFLRADDSAASLICGSFVSLGGIDTKYIGQKHGRINLSTSDGFHVGFDENIAYCSQGERECTEEEFAIAEKQLKQFEFPITSPEKVRDLAFPLLHNCVKGFKAVLSEHDAKEMVENENNSLFDTALASFSRLYLNNFSKLNDRFINYIQSHQTSMGKGLLFLSFLSLATREKNPKIRHAYYKHLSMAWLKYCELSSTTLFTSLATNIIRSPKQTKALLDIAKGILLCKWMQDIKFLPSLRSISISSHFSNGHIPCFHKDGACYLPCEQSPVTIAIDCIKAVQSLPVQEHSDCLTLLCRDMGLQMSATNGIHHIIRIYVECFEEPELSAALSRQFQTSLSVHPFYAYMLTTTLLDLMSMQQLLSSMAKNDKGLPEAMQKLINLIAALPENLKLEDVHPINAFLSQLEQKDVRAILGHGTVLDYLNLVLIIVIKRLIDMRKMACLEAAKVMLVQLLKHQLLTFQKSCDIIKDLLSIYYQQTLSHEPAKLLQAARFIKELEGWSDMPPHLRKKYNSIADKIDAEMLPATERQVLSMGGVGDFAPAFSSLSYCLAHSSDSFAQEKKILALFDIFLRQAFAVHQIKCMWYAGILALELLKSNRISERTYPKLRNLLRDLMAFSESDAIALDQLKVNCRKLGLSLLSYLEPVQGTVRTLLKEMAQALKNEKLHPYAFQSIVDVFVKMPRVQEQFQAQATSLNILTQNNPALSFCVLQFIQMVAEIELSILKEVFLEVHPLMDSSDREIAVVVVLMSYNRRTKQPMELWQWLETKDKGVSLQQTVLAVDLLMASISNPKAHDRVPIILKSVLENIAEIDSVKLLNVLHAMIAQIKSHQIGMIQHVTNLLFSIAEHYGDTRTLQELTLTIIKKCVHEKVHFPAKLLELYFARLLSPSVDRAKSYLEVTEKLQEESLFFIEEIFDAYKVFVASQGTVLSVPMAEFVAHEGLRLAKKFLAHEGMKREQLPFVFYRMHLASVAMKLQLYAWLLERNDWAQFCIFWNNDDFIATASDKEQMSLFRLLTRHPHTSDVLSFIFQYFIDIHPLNPEYLEGWMALLIENCDGKWINTVQHLLIDSGILEGDEMPLAMKVSCISKLFLYIQQLSGQLRYAEEIDGYLKLLFFVWDKLPIYLADLPDTKPISELLPSFFAVFAKRLTFNHFVMADGLTQKLATASLKADFTAKLLLQYVSAFCSQHNIDSLLQLYTALLTVIRQSLDNPLPGQVVLSLNSSLSQLFNHANIQVASSTAKVFENIPLQEPQLNLRRKIINRFAKPVEEPVEKEKKNLDVGEEIHSIVKKLTRLAAKDFVGSHDELRTLMKTTNQAINPLFGFKDVSLDRVVVLKILRLSVRKGDSQTSYSSPSWLREEVSKLFVNLYETSLFTLSKTNEQQQEWIHAFLGDMRVLLVMLLEVKMDNDHPAHHQIIHLLKLDQLLRSLTFIRKNDLVAFAKQIDYVLLSIVLKASVMQSNHLFEKLKIFLRNVQSHKNYQKPFNFGQLLIKQIQTWLSSMSYMDRFFLIYGVENEPAKGFRQDNMESNEIADTQILLSLSDEEINRLCHKAGQAKFKQMVNEMITILNRK